MRLIDADALVIDMVIEEAETPLMPWYPSHMPMRKTDGVSIEQINNSPTIDAVPVVRCKDCKWYGRVDKRRFYRGMDCLQKHIDTIVPDRDFCSKAERRGEQNE